MTTKKAQASTTNDMGDQTQQDLLRDWIRVREAFIRDDGKSVVMTPRPTDWSGFFGSGLTASADFMVESEHMPVQERTLQRRDC